MSHFSINKYHAILYCTIKVTHCHLIPIRQSLYTIVHTPNKLINTHVLSTYIYYYWYLTPFIFCPGWVISDYFQGPMPTNKIPEQPPTSQQGALNTQMMKTQSPMNHNAVKPLGNTSQMNHSPSKNNLVAKQSQVIQRTEAKQKPRTYTNSTAKMASPPNLTKFLMQGSYPMQQYNFHNANHHPMLNNRGAVFTNTQFANNLQMLNNQRPNGTFNNGTRWVNIWYFKCLDLLQNLTVLAPMHCQLFYCWPIMCKHVF